MNKHISRKTFLIYLLQLPFFRWNLKAFYLVQPETRYLLNKFSIAEFCFDEGVNILEKMKIWETLRMKRDANNKYDNHAIELHWQNVKVGFVPMSDNRHLFRLLELDLVCTILEINPDEETWQMCKIKVELKHPILF
ncbi:HIRAN domain-containing protein [Candidatus Marinimicrobia bacterium]|nr:HIRAN domain-containing protein [Candidatus Neomarinimicrobiota bacterium]